MFFAAGGATNNSRLPSGTTYQLGGGGESFIYKGFGVGAEIAAAGPATGFEYGVGSVNFSYHLLPGLSERKLEPFVSAGYTFFLVNGVTSGANAGAGVNWWLSKNLALRFELRDNFEGRGDLIGFRIGMTFR